MFQYFTSPSLKPLKDSWERGERPKRAGQPAIVVTSGASSSFVHLPLVRKGDDAEKRWRTRGMVVQIEGDATLASAS